MDKHNVQKREGHRREDVLRGFSAANAMRPTHAKPSKLMPIGADNEVEEREELAERTTQPEKDARIREWLNGMAQADAIPRHFDVQPPVFQIATRKPAQTMVSGVFHDDFVAEKLRAEIKVHSKQKAPRPQPSAVTFVESQPMVVVADARSNSRPTSAEVVSRNRQFVAAQTIHQSAAVSTTARVPERASAAFDAAPAPASSSFTTLVRRHTGQVEARPVNSTTSRGASQQRLSFPSGPVPRPPIGAAISEPLRRDALAVGKSRHDAPPAAEKKSQHSTSQGRTQTDFESPGLPPVPNAPMRGGTWSRKRKREDDDGETGPSAAALVRKPDTQSHEKSTEAEQPPKKRPLLRKPQPQFIESSEERNTPVSLYNDPSPAETPESKRANPFAPKDSMQLGFKALYFQRIRDGIDGIVMDGQKANQKTQNRENAPLVRRLSREVTAQPLPFRPAPKSRSPSPGPMRRYRPTPTFDTSMPPPATRRVPPAPVALHARPSPHDVASVNLWDPGTQDDVFDTVYQT